MQLPHCPQCERERGVYGVEMLPHQTTEPWRDGWRCPDCGLKMAREEVDARAIFDSEDDRYPINEQRPDETTEEYARRLYDERVERVERREPGIKHGGGSNGRSRKRVPKADERIAPKGNDPTLCWRCGGPLAGGDGRERYCDGCKDAAARAAKAERDARYRERKAELA